MHLPTKEVVLRLNGGCSDENQVGRFCPTFMIFRSPLIRWRIASYASPALDTTNLPPEQASPRSVGFRVLGSTF
jgi:hypothetical protein